jgi:hypothetical protein
MANLILSGSTSGSVTLSSPAVSGTTTLTLPTTTGNVVTDTATQTLTNKTLTSPTITGATITVAATANPTFSAYQSSSQSLSIGTTKILYQTEQWDTNNNFASSTFTPTVAGYYQISCAASFGGAASNKTIFLYKNGSNYRRGTEALTTQLSMSSLIYFNGSSDYVEVYVNTATSVSTDNVEDRTWFCGVFVRSA